MEKQEAKLKSLLFKELSRASPGLVVQQMASAGSPDRSTTWRGRTCHWEFKNAVPDFISPGLQELTCMRLAVAGHCKYVIWQERGAQKRTLIVHPRMVKERAGWHVIPEAFCVGFDIQWLVQQILIAHDV